VSGSAASKGGRPSTARPTLHRDHRDDKLWALLPPNGAPYDFRCLSRAETDSLVEALRDGYGGTLYPDHQAMPLPSEVKSGLLEHSFYVAPSSEYDPVEWHDAFWVSPGNEDEPPPSEWFPLQFVVRRLRVYFQNQFDRFCGQLSRDDPGIIGPSGG